MGDQWQDERRGDFGWSIEGSSEIKALWLPHVDFADPKDKISGKIATSTAHILERRIADYASEITPRPNLRTALYSGQLTAHGVSDKLGGGYLIVLVAGLINFQTIATVGPATVPTGNSERSTEAMQETEAISSNPLLATRIRNWLSRIFPFGATARLATHLTSNDEAIFIPAITEAVKYAPNGNDRGIRAMEEAMRRRAGQRNLAFLPPIIGSLTARDGGTITDAPELLVQLTRDKSLLRNPCVSQDLMSACVNYHGEEEIRACILKAFDIGGPEQGFIFQLLYNHMLQVNKLAHIRGARSWTEQMSE